MNNDPARTILGSFRFKAELLYFHIDASVTFDNRVVCSAVVSKRLEDSSGNDVVGAIVTILDSDKVVDLDLFTPNPVITAVFHMAVKCYKFHELYKKDLTDSK